MSARRSYADRYSGRFLPRSLATGQWYRLANLRYWGRHSAHEYRPAACRRPGGQNRAFRKHIAPAHPGQMVKHRCANHAPANDHNTVWEFISPPFYSYCFSPASETKKTDGRCQAERLGFHLQNALPAEYSNKYPPSLFQQNCFLLPQGKKGAYFTHATGSRLFLKKFPYSSGHRLYGDCRGGGDLYANRGKATEWRAASFCHCVFPCLSGAFILSPAIFYKGVGVLATSPTLCK